MCQVSRTPTRTTEKPERVFKLVNPITATQFRSLWNPEHRSAWIGERGTILLYDLGAEVASPSGPGIMAYRTIEQAEEERDTHIRYDRSAAPEHSVAIIELEIPANAPVHEEIWNDRVYAIAAPRVKVIAVHSVRTVNERGEHARVAHV